MKAVLCHRFGSVADLQIEEAADPQPGPGQIEIDVRAVGINFFDGLQIAGKYQRKPPFPFSPGAEIAGVVSAGHGGLVRGTRVLAFLGYGGLAEKVVADAWRVAPIPDEMDFTTAAAFPVVYLTSLHALRDRGQLRAGESLLVLGAAGGVGLAAVEIGKAMGARVIAAASTPEKLALCRAHGADDTINYASEDLRERLKQITQGRGVDVVYDPVGDRFTEPCVRSLAPGGRLLIIGFAAGEIPKLPLNLLLLKQAAAVGVMWGGFAEADPEANAAHLRQLFAWYREGRVVPHLSRSFDLAEFRDAIDLVMNRGALGKVVVTIGR